MKNRGNLINILTAIAITLVLVLIAVFAVSGYLGFKGDSNDNEYIIYDNTPNAVTPTPIPSETPIKTVSIPNTDAKSMGFDIAKLQELDQFVYAEIEDGFPGAVIMIAKDGKIVFEKSYGYSKIYDGFTKMDTPMDMQNNTMFDVASLTKIYSTTFCIMKLYEDGLLDLEDRVFEYLPNYVGANKEHVTISMLLSHKSGHTSNHKMYLQTIEGNANEFYAANRVEAKRLIEMVPLDDVPNTVEKYCDTNYMLLGNIIENVTGMTIDEYAHENVYKPLGLKNTMYKPMENGIVAYDCAATERCGNTRDYLVDFEGVRTHALQGEVHDENCYYSFEGVSGHAGLFSDAYGLTAMNVMLLNNGYIDDAEIFEQSTIDRFMNIYDDSYYQLGFWNASAYSKLKDYVSDRTFYHNGWTGCASVVDYENNLSIILLTNKRHCAIVDEKFETDKYDLGKYYKVIQMTYDALIN